MRANKIDANQPEIVKALRSVGCSVQVLNKVKDGCPDILVGFRKKNYLMEIKDGSKPKCQQVLTSDEKDWFDKWQGDVVKVTSIETALKTIDAYYEN